MLLTYRRGGRESPTLSSPSRRRTHQDDEIATMNNDTDDEYYHHLHHRHHHRHDGGASLRLGMAVFAGCAIGIYLYTVFFLSTFEWQQDYDQILESIWRLGDSNHLYRQVSLADDCYHVFLDVGANIGVHGRFLYEPDSYHDAGLARALFQQEFGTTGDNRDVCVFAFEPNPNHLPRLQQISDAYQKMGWRYTPMPLGVSDEDGTITFFKQGDDKRMEWGFSALIPTLKSGKQAKKIDIPVIRLANWLETHIWNRRLPKKVYGNYEGIVSGEGRVGGPKVVMKMDIEAMEFRVLPDLMMSGILCKTVDFLFGEIHDDKMYYPIHLPNNVTLNNGKKGRTHMESMIRALQANPNCNTRIVEEDDEAYLRDGIDLPVPTKV